MLSEIELYKLAIEGLTVRIDDLTNQRAHMEMYLREMEEESTIRGRGRPRKDAVPPEPAKRTSKRKGRKWTEEQKAAVRERAKQKKWISKSVELMKDLGESERTSFDAETAELNSEEVLTNVE